jgi:hypothetical protein
MPCSSRPRLLTFGEVQRCVRVPSLTGPKATRRNSSHDNVSKAHQVTPDLLAFFTQGWNDVHFRMLFLDGVYITSIPMARWGTQGRAAGPCVL